MADRPMRADARRNLARVLEAAEEVLAHEGAAASIRQIAQRAGLGLGTIYRQFATKEDLYRAVLHDRVSRLLDSARARIGTGDPGAAFYGVFTEIVEVSTRKKIIADALAESGVDAKAGMDGLRSELVAVLAEALRRAQEAGAVLAEALRRAQEAGAVREDLGMAELLALLGALSLAAERGQWDARFRERTLGFVYDGLRPKP